MSLNPAQTNERATAFISYAHEDEEFVQRLRESLRGQGVEPVGDWMLVAGEKYEGRLRKLALAAQAFVFVITPDSVASKACKDELALAVENKKQVLPVSHRAHGDDDLLDSALRAPQWTFLRKDSDYEAGIQKLVKAINTDFGLMETHGRLLLAAEEWKDNGRNRSYLLRKDGLKEAEAWLAKTSAQSGKFPQPTPLQTEFILAGQSARSRGVRIAFGVAAAIVLTLSGLTAYALYSAREARRQQKVAEANAARALEQGKRRLMVATLMLNPEGTSFTFLQALNRDLLFGIRPWALRDGSLNTVLRKFHEREPELFVRIFGDGNAALAERLLAYVGTPAGEALPLESVVYAWKGTPTTGDVSRDWRANDDGSVELGDTKPRPAGEASSLPDTRPRYPPEFPEGNLNREPWLTRFKRASKEPAFQAIQYEEHTGGYLSYMDEMRRFAPQVKTERGTAFMLDLAFHMGPRWAEELFLKARAESPGVAEPELLRRVAELSAESQSRPFLANAIRRRRALFLTTPFFSDRELGF